MSVGRKKNSADRLYSWEWITARASPRRSMASAGLHNSVSARRSKQAENLCSKIGHGHDMGVARILNRETTTRALRKANKMKQMHDAITAAAANPALQRIVGMALRGISHAGSADSYSCIGGKEYIDCGSWTSQA